jgi:hypothetical protein
LPSFSSLYLSTHASATLIPDAWRMHPWRPSRQQPSTKKKAAAADAARKALDGRARAPKRERRKKSRRERCIDVAEARPDAFASPMIAAYHFRTMRVIDPARRNSPFMRRVQTHVEIPRISRRVIESWRTAFGALGQKSLKPIPPNSRTLLESISAATRRRPGLQSKRIRRPTAAAVAASARPPMEARAPSSEWRPGVRLRCRTVAGEEIEGTVFCYDAGADCLVLRIETAAFSRVCFLFFLFFLSARSARRRSCPASTPIGEIAAKLLANFS